MHCPYCAQKDTRVIETRDAKQSVRRRRACQSCNKRFTTYERVEKQQLRIIKKDGSRETFKRDKLKQGLLVACEKRPVSHDEIDQAVHQIEEELRKQNTVEVRSEDVGTVAMSVLRELDEVAYIRFASVYKRFKDIDSFKEEIDELHK